VLNLRERNRYIKYGNDAEGYKWNLMIGNLLGRNKPSNLGPRLIDNLKQLIKQIRIALWSRQNKQQSLTH
jgi:hypothetical protein